MIKDKKILAFLYFILFAIYIITTNIAKADEITGKAWIEQKQDNTFIGIILNINDGAYLYHTNLGDKDAIGTPLQISLSGNTYRIKGFTTSPPKIKSKKTFSKPPKPYNVNVHTGTMYIYLQLEKNKQLDSIINTKPKKQKPISVNLHGQVCNKQRCLQVSLTLPVINNAKSIEASEVFAAMPKLSKFSKPIPEWNSIKVKQRQNLNTAMSNIRNLNSSTKPLVNQLKVNSNFSKNPSLTEIAPLTEEKDNTLYKLPEFHLRKDTSEYQFIVWLGIALVAGILLNFMPCVLPVISLKIIGFVNQAHESRKRLILLSLSFSGGIISVFLALAFAAASFGMQWGEQFQSETFNIILACLVFAFALSFLGVFEFSAPEFAGKLQSGKSLPREGYLGAYCTGIIATLMATPCSGPFLGTTISWALTQKPFTVITIFLFIGIGMALPYFLLSLSSKLRNLLPKPGDWMLTFRTIMGFVLLLTVIYLMLFIKAENLLATCSLMVFIAFSCWIFGKYATILHKQKIRWLARICSIAIIFIGAYLAFVVLNPIISTKTQPNKITLEVEATNESSDRTSIHPFDFKSFQRDLASGKNILVDFTADWCPNCQYNSHYVFSSEQVLNKLKNKNIIFYKADLTDDTPKTKRIRSFLKSLGGSAIPYAGIFPANAPDSPYVLPDILTVSKVTDILDKLPNTKMSKGL